MSNEEKIKRIENGSIDCAFYIARGRQIRGQAACSALAEMGEAVQKAPTGFGSILNRFRAKLSRPNKANHRSESALMAAE